MFVIFIHHDSPHHYSIHHSPHHYSFWPFQSNQNCDFIL